MKKKSKRRKYTNQLLDSIEINNNNNNNETCCPKSYMTTIYVPSKRNNGNNYRKHEEEISSNIANNNNNAEKEYGNVKDFCNIIKESFETNSDNLDNYYTTSYFDTPVWFQSVVEILCKDLHVL